SACSTTSVAVTLPDRTAPAIVLALAASSTRRSIPGRSRPSPFGPARRGAARRGATRPVGAHAIHVQDARYAVGRGRSRWGGTGASDGCEAQTGRQRGR